MSDEPWTKRLAECLKELSQLRRARKLWVTVLKREKGRLVLSIDDERRVDRESADGSESKEGNIWPDYLKTAREAQKAFIEGTTSLGVPLALPAIEGAPQISDDEMTWVAAVVEWASRHIVDKDEGRFDLLAASEGFTSRLFTLRDAIPASAEGAKLNDLLDWVSPPEEELALTGNPLLSVSEVLRSLAEFLRQFRSRVSESALDTLLDSLYWCCRAEGRWANTNDGQRPFIWRSIDGESLKWAIPGGGVLELRLRRVPHEHDEKYSLEPAADSASDANGFEQVVTWLEHWRDVVESVSFQPVTNLTNSDKLPPLDSIPGKSAPPDAPLNACEPFDARDYVLASVVIRAHTPPGVVLNDKRLKRFLERHKESIRTRRPPGRDGKPRKNRHLIHLADWHNHRDALIEWDRADRAPVEETPLEDVYERYQGVRSKKERRK